MVEPKRHAPALGDLPDEEAAAIGQATNRVARLQREVLGAEHLYSFVYGDGVPHLHVHLAPRYPGTPNSNWGHRLQRWPDAPTVAPDEMRDLTAQLRRALHRS